MNRQRVCLAVAFVAFFEILVYVDGFNAKVHREPFTRNVYGLTGGPHRQSALLLRSQKSLRVRSSIFSLKEGNIFNGSSSARANQSSSNNSTITTSLSVVSLNIPDTPNIVATTSTNNEATGHDGPSVPQRAVTAVDSPVQPSFPVVLWRFTRPHTLIGSALAIPSLHLLAAPTWASIWTWKHAASILYALVPSLLMNLYVTGLNQITDVEIDKINKPNLPLAAGILSRRNAIVTCVVALLLSLGLGYAHPVYGTSGLQTVLWGSAILGTLYSLPPFRLKRFPLLAAFCIVAVRGTIINASFFAHAQAAAGFGAPTATVIHCLRTNARCFWSSLFFGCFGIVIALMKDVPDVLGDRGANVRTFAVRVGPQRIFHASRHLLTGLLTVCAVSFGVGAIMPAVAAAGAGSSSSSVSMATLVRAAAGRCVVATGAGWAARSVSNEATRVDPENPTMVYQYYMHLWKLFYLCYLVLPLAR